MNEQAAGAPRPAVAKTTVRFRAYRFTLDPTSTQLEQLAQHAGAARWAYNYAIAAKEAAWQLRSAAIDELVTFGYPEATARKMVATKVPNYAVIAAKWRSERMTAIDPRQACTWHTTVSSYVFSSAFQGADKAYRAWFDSMAGKRAGKAVGRPRFKRKGRARDSFQIFHDVKKPTIRIENHRRILVPRLGSLRIHNTAKPLTRKILAGTAVVKSVTISRGAHRWYASLLVEETVALAQTTRRQRATGVVGVDVGVAQLAALSTGELIANSRRGQAASRCIARAARSYARTRKHSNRRAAAARRLARLHHQVAVQRTGDIHQLTKRLATQFETVIVEDLNLAGMTRRPAPKPDTETVGAFLPNGTAAKSGLNRALADSALGELRRQLTYKTTWYASQLIAVNAAYTSQTCSACGHIAQENRKSQAAFSCVKCGHTINADINAAWNIRARGILAPENRERLNARRDEERHKVADLDDEAGRPGQPVLATGGGAIRPSPKAA